MANKSESGGIGLFGAVFLVFLVLKLTGQIDWSWWYVTMPLYVTSPLWVIAFLILLKRRKTEKKEEERLAEYLKSHGGGKKSKFMQKLDEAVAESEKRRNTKDN